ncbi:MAG TPA: tetratricopeptide repeat protein [Longimicrobium sp.]
MSSATRAPAPAAEDARALAERAGEAEGLGQWDEAARLYALAFRASVLRRDLAAAADALRGQARVRNHERRFDEAEELAQLSLTIAEENGLRQAAARALNVLGHILQSRGDWEEAREYFPRALEMALDLGDDDLAGLACLNAGNHATATGNLREARTLYLESIGSFVRSGNSVHAMMAYNNLGLASVDLREWLDAEVYFGRGIEIGERLSHSPFLARLYCNRAEPLIQVGELARARATLHRAEAAAASVGDRAGFSEVQRYLGWVATAEGDHAAAEAHLHLALQAADDSSLALERGKALQQLARLRQRQGRLHEAHELFGQAHEIFTAIGAEQYARSMRDRLHQVENLMSHS